MKIENIKFSQEASKRVYNDYMKRIIKVTDSLSKRDQNDVYMEFNSHIFEAIQHKNGADEIDVLLNILEKLGIPEEVLKPLIADKKLEQATRTFNPIHILKALALNFTNGLSYIVFFFLYILLFGFVFLIPAKIIYPSEIGMFYRENSLLFFGWSNKANQNGVTELLGNWFIPVMLTSIFLFYVFTTFLLKLKKTINQK
ncbi:hypothetical protein QLS91_11645 [Flavobacterium sp. LB2P84]|uniref:DUF1700 domain-containing protein n=1 Tax=Flavobacterium yafengii TaxID=3041253 RepID=A0AAW6TPG2_9FLAO|nr:hypothetical protein [Flavobacterium yafengii]MDI5950364.1 hypothetical protein [Flavobacterium yafengii]MDI6033729.1 hypothetical protein [Flavobacterium yafengii]